jgi:hypothetical protein
LTGSYFSFLALPTVAETFRTSQLGVHISAGRVFPRGHAERPMRRLGFEGLADMAGLEVPGSEPALPGPPRALLSSPGSRGRKGARAGSRAAGCEGALWPASAASAWPRWPRCVPLASHPRVADALPMARPATCHACFMAGTGGRKTVLEHLERTSAACGHFSFCLNKGFAWSFKCLVVKYPFGVCRFL